MVMSSYVIMSESWVYRSIPQNWHFNGEVMIIDDKPDKASNLVLCFQTNPSHRNRLVCIREVGLTPSHQTHYIGLDLHFQDQRTAFVSGALGF